MRRSEERRVESQTARRALEKVGLMEFGHMESIDVFPRGSKVLFNLKIRSSVNPNLDAGYCR